MFLCGETVSVCDACPTINQHWINVSCLLGSSWCKSGMSCCITSMTYPPEEDLFKAAARHACILVLLPLWQRVTSSQLHSVIHRLFSKTAFLPGILAIVDHGKMRVIFCRATNSDRFYYTGSMLDQRWINNITICCWVYDAIAQHRFNVSCLLGCDSGLW